MMTGGGTGGHLYPGIAVAKELEKIDASIRIIFIGCNRGIEKKLLAKEKYKYHLIPIGPLNGVSRSQQLLSFLQLPIAIIISLFLILKYRPSQVIGFGGYASGPLMLAALLLKKKCYLWEGNAHPGLVTRKLAPFVEKIFLAFPSDSPVYKNLNTEVIGVPTRFHANSSPEKKHDNKINILSFGGSQGSKAINDILLSFWKYLKNKKSVLLNSINVIHQVGRYQIHEMEKEYADFADNFECHEFIYDMKDKLAWADIVICRSGASTVAEVALSQKVAVFIPLPSAADDHQTKNAKTLADAGAAILMPQSQVNNEKLEDLFTDLLSNREKYQAMGIKAKEFSHPNSSLEVAKQLI